MKKVLYILFHRSVLVALSLLAQVVTLVVMVNIFSEYISSFYCIRDSLLSAGGRRAHPQADQPPDAPRGRAVGGKPEGGLQGR